MTGPIDLIKQSLQIYFEKKNLIYFLKIYAILLPFLILAVNQDKLISSPDQLLGKYAWLIPVAIIIGLAYLLLSFWVSASGIIAVWKVTAGEELSFKETYGLSWKVLGKFALLQLIVGLITGLGFILLIVLDLVFGLVPFFGI